jgi:hypothetical protein
MDKEEAIKLIDDHKNGLINPVEMLHWAWLRVIINQVDDHEWAKAVEKAGELMQ